MKRMNGFHPQYYHSGPELCGAKTLDEFLCFIM